MAFRESIFLVGRVFRIVLVCFEVVVRLFGYFWGSIMFGKYRCLGLCWEGCIINIIYLMFWVFVEFVDVLNF